MTEFAKNFEKRFFSMKQHLNKIIQISLKNFSVYIEDYTFEVIVCYMFIFLFVLLCTFETIL